MRAAASGDNDSVCSYIGERCMELVGIWGRPYIDLEPYVDTSRFAEIDDEICWGLTRVRPSYTGGNLKWMGIVAPSVARDRYVDYGHVISRFSRREFEAFVALGEQPDRFDPDRRSEYTFGDETDHPLTRAQQLYLKYRYGAYFPWKVAYHLVENHLWDDKHSGEDKRIEPEAETVFPKTVAFIRSLPFREIGRCLIFGLEANDHAPLHRDTEPYSKSQDELEHSMSICPRGDKRFFLTDPLEKQHVFVEHRAYWFNDMDYHGVAADPFFRYSIRVDGVFLPEFYQRLKRDCLERRPP